jgi:AhpD family alkylhydroperoxidase
MSRPIPVQYDEASPEIRAVYDDIKITRKMSDVPNFWKYLATNPALLKRTWETQKQILALDVLTKELIYLAVSVTNGCSYGVAAHTTIAQEAGHDR